MPPPRADEGAGSKVGPAIMKRPQTQATGHCIFFSFCVLLFLMFDPVDIHGLGMTWLRVEGLGA